MFGLKIKNSCCRLKNRLRKAMLYSFNLNAGPFAEHLASCPRCRKRLARYGNIKLAMSLLKTQPCTSDLLGRANVSAIKALRRSLRDTTAADKLKTAKPQINWFIRQTRRFQPLLGAAACIIFIMLLKAGVFSSMEDMKQTSETAVHNYYAKNLDSAQFDEIFGA